ncbi:hypothetical protein [Spirillospora sp. NPDC029432]|uniref:hypothetical protein n=1 Tax=Spirillospora sp. NPDC029432 TaxID=3154599 RepID=UPI0034545912
MRRHALIALLLLPALALGACGGGGSGGEGTKKAADDGARMREYAKCMRANGVDMPDPSADGRVEVKVTGGKPGEDRLKAAEEKCRKLMPNGGKLPKPDAKRMAEARAMSKCMRENGVPDFPDPDPETGGIQIKGRKGGGGLDPGSATFRKADKICNKNGGGRLESRHDDGDGPGLSGRSGE